MPQSPSITTNPEMSTPGSIFINRKSNFITEINDFYHYKLENLQPMDGYHSLPTKKRMAINMSLASNKNEIDPYVHASNWLPKLKGYCRGYLARKKADELRKKHEAVRVIQRAAKDFMDPLVQIFYRIRPTLNIIKLDELKKYLRECIFQIKKLNAERAFIDSQLDDVDRNLDQSLNINDSNCLSLEGRRSPNIFGKLSELKSNLHNDTFLKECLDLKIKGFDDIEIEFDPISCQSSKVQSVYEKSDRVQIKIHENQHKLQELINKCDSLEKEIKELRANNSNLESSGRMMKGILHKGDMEKQEQTNKINDMETSLKKLEDERKTLLAKMKDNESKLTEKNNLIKELTTKCDFLDSDLEQKIKTIGLLNQEKITSEKKMKELNESMNYNTEMQSELEQNLESMKNRMKDMKKRFQENVKAMEDDYEAQKNSDKNYIQDLTEQNESLSDKVKQLESTIRRLERDITDSVDKGGSDEEIDRDRERKLSFQLKNCQAANDSLKEELRITESNYEESRKKNREFEVLLEESNKREVEDKKQIERLKTDNQILKSSSNEVDLNIHRLNREKQIISQKLQTSKDTNAALENEISKLKDEFTLQTQNYNSKNKDIENLNEEIFSLKRDYEQKLFILNQDKSDLQTELEKALEKLNSIQQELKEFKEYSKQEIEEQKQLLEEKEMEQENTIDENRKNIQKIRQLQKKIENYEESLNDYEKTIAKLKDENKSLKDESFDQNLLSPTDFSSMFLTRSSSSVSPGYRSLPRGKGKNS